MCEWLSCQEWFDVQIFCGGRTFNAHRAVLASVSTFLQEILLSCSSEDSPVFILPDFDIEAMSSVLHYIYNGEVVVQSHKYQMFIDIVKAMRIFLDSKYLEGNGINNINLRENNETQNFHDTNIIGLDENELKINSKLIKRTSQQTKPMETWQIHSVSKTNLYKNHELDHLSKQQKSPLENLQLPFLDRQRNSFLRDLFIETYPENGYVNGWARGVPAMPRECYHEPRSVLLTNANGHIRAGGPLSGTRSHVSRTLDCNNSLLNSDRSYELVYGQKIEDYVSSSYCHNINYKITHLNYLTSSKSTVKFSQLYQTTNQVLSNEIKTIQRRENKNRTKNSILNQVLDSPWCARQPNNYKPLSKNKHNSHNYVSNNDTEPTNTEVSDDNNNGHQKNQKSPLPLLPTITTPLTNNHFSISMTNNETGVEQVPNEPSATSAAQSPSSGVRYSCSECFKSFSQLRNFKYHMSVHRGTREFAATCPVCGKYFNDRGYLSSHMKIHRNRKEYKCSMCPKSFNQRVAYNMHVRIHTGVKPHACEECGKAFARKMLLKQHQRVHSGERPYACPHCDKKFADRSNMTLHLRLHSGIKPFTCTLCPKSFTKKHHLKSHLNFHSGIKPYSCPRCKLAFTQSSNMRTHLKKCSGPTGSK